MRRAAPVFAFLLTTAACTGIGGRAPDFTPSDALPARSTVIASDAILFDSNRTGNFEVFVQTIGDPNPIQLTSDSAYDSWWARISPDRSLIVFLRTPAGVHDTEFTDVSLWVMAADGSNPTLLRPAGLGGWDLQGHVEWSPDGSQLVMFGGKRDNPQIFITSNLGTDPRQVTDRPGTNIDPSWSPDGRSIVFIGCPQAECYPEDYEVYLADLEAGEGERRLTNDSRRDHDPYFSPGGDLLAWLTQMPDEGAAGRWSIQVTSLTPFQPRFLIDDGAINSYPSWSPDGTLIYFHRLSLGETEFDIYSIRPDGSELTPVTVGQPGVNEHPSS